MSLRQPPTAPPPTDRLLLAAACIGALIAAGCLSERIRQDCRLERETVIATTARPPSDVGVARGAGESWLVAWSVDGSTRVAWIDGRPAVTEVARVLREGPLAPLEREPDDRKTFWEADDVASLAAAALQVVPVGGGAALLALVQSPGPGRAGGAHAVLVPPSPLLGEPRAVRLGPAGPASDRITVAVLGRRAVIAWHDVAPGGRRFVFLRLRQDPAGGGEPRQLVWVDNWFAEVQELVPN